MNRLSKSHIVLALLATGCTTAPRHPVSSTGANVLTPMQLIASIDAHKGRTVTVTGYFTYVVDTRALWENEDAHRDAQRMRKGSWDKCITIYLPSMRIDRQRQFNGHRVRITGKAVIIEEGDFRSLWTCNPVALEDAVMTTR